jgi:hypothetical protein
MERLFEENDRCGQTIEQTANRRNQERNMKNLYSEQYQSLARVRSKRGTSVGESCGTLRARLIEKTHRTNLFARAFR